MARAAFVEVFAQPLGAFFATAVSKTLAPEVPRALVVLPQVLGFPPDGSALRLCSRSVHVRVATDDLGCSVVQPVFLLVDTLAFLPGLAADVAELCSANASYDRVSTAVS